ncbi:MAG: hypothetical protein M3259_01965 [Actinomycetota bacterium]|nr:hypothetical protein [Actinomycetota bacterium]
MLDHDGSKSRRHERSTWINAYLDEIGSPVGPVAFATNEEGALLGLRVRDGRYLRMFVTVNCPSA